MSYTEHDILNYLEKNGIIPNRSDICDEIDNMKKKELLSKHPYKVYFENQTKKWCVYIPDKDGIKRLKRRKTREEIDKLIIDYQKTLVRNPTLEELFEMAYGQKLEYGDIDRSTYETYKKVFVRFYNSRIGIGALHVMDISEDELTRFLHLSIKEFGLTAKGFQKLKGITREIFLFAKEQHFINWSIGQLLGDFRVSKNTFRRIIKEDKEEVFNEEEFSAVIRYLIHNQDLYNLAILLIFVSGLRVGELVSLKWEDVCDNRISVKRTETSYHDSETGKPIYEVKNYPKTEAGVRTVLIPDDFHFIFDQIRNLKCGNSEYIFFRKGERIHTYHIRRRLGYVLDKLNIYQKSPHKIRKTYISILLDCKIDNNMILKQVGHADINVSENNYHRNRKSLEERGRIVSALPEFRVGKTNDVCGVCSAIS